MAQKSLRTFASAAAVFCAVNASANPADGNVVAGSATITSAGNNLNINQTTNRAIIDWRNFDIAPNESTNFIQPDSNSVALNRVTNNMPTNIQGNLTANGNVILVNQSGIVFSQGSKVDVGGLVATTSDISNDKFMSGDMKFDKPGNANATIENSGTITVRDAGLVGLVAPQIINSGIINARLGRVNMVAGDLFTLDLYGDGLIEIGIGDNSTIQKIENSGIINADGGQIAISAAAARNVVDSLIHIQGELNTPTVTEHKGKIVITNARPKSQTKLAANETVSGVTIDGTLNATGEQGGSIEIYGDDILLNSGAQLDVSGDNGGGNILIGGDYQGSGDNTTALRTIIETGVDLKSNANETGDAGKVIVWADDQTYFEGAIEAKSKTGKGGFAEVSGANYLAFNGTVNLLSDTGNDGSLLLDPTDITISSGTTANVSSSGTTTVTYVPTTDNLSTILNVTTLNNLLGTSNVIVQTKATGTDLGNINVNAPITWSSTKSLSLTAHNLININSTIDANAAAQLTLQSSDIALGAAINGHGVASVTFMTNGGNMQLGASTAGYTYALSAAELNNISGFATTLFGGGTSNITVDAGAMTWAYYPHIRTSSTGIITISGAQSSPSSFELATNTLNINSTMASTGAGTLLVRATADGTSLGLGTDSTGTLKLDDAELANILGGGWGTITFGSTTGSFRFGSIDVYTTHLSSINFLSNLNFLVISSANPVTIRTPINVSTKNLSIETRNISLNADISGTGTLTFFSDGATSMGFGDGAGGSFQLDDSELANIHTGWSSVTFGDTTSTSSLTIKTAQTWSSPIIFNEVDAGTFTLASGAAQNFGANDVIINATNVNIQSSITGTGNLTIRPVTNNTVGIGGATGASGATFEIDNTEIGFINNSNWSSISLGLGTNTSLTTLAGATTWATNLTVLGGATNGISVTGAQTMGAGKSLTLNARAIDIAADLSGTATSTLSIVTTSASTTTGLGDSAGGTIQLDNAELDHIKDGWGNLIFGYTGTATTSALTANAYTWKDNVEFRSGAGSITISGAQNVGANNLTLTGNGMTINAALTGTGIFTVQEFNSTAVTIGAASAGNYVNNSELDFIGSGWSKIIIGSVTNNSTITFNDYTFGTDVEFRNGTGILTLAAVNVGTHSLTIYNAGNISFTTGGSATGSGTLTIKPYNNATIGLGGTAASGTINLTSAEIVKIADGWSSIVIGDATSTAAAMDVQSATWKDNLTLIGGTNGINFSAGTVTFTSSNLTVQSSTDVTIAAALVGTGTLTFTPNSDLTIGLGDGATGVFNLTNAEIANLGTGWADTIIGNSAGTGAIDVQATSWVGNTTLNSLSGAININGIQNVAANKSFTLKGDNINIGAAINSVGSTGNTSRLAIIPQSAISMGIGTGSTGTLNISDTELGFISNNGWVLYNFGVSSASLFTPTATSVDFFSSNLSLINLVNITGGRTYIGAQNTISIRTPLTVSQSLNIISADANIAADVTGGATILIAPLTHTSLGLGTGAGGSMQFDDAELDHLLGWLTYNFSSGTLGTSNITFKTARTWNGIVTISGLNDLLDIKATQNFGVNGFTANAQSVNIAADLIGTQSLTINPLNDATVAIGGTTGASGATFELDDSEIAHINNKGWTNIILGSSTNALSMVVNGAANWSSNLLLSNAGLITINANQDMGIHDLSLRSDSTPVFNSAVITGSGVLKLRVATNAGLMSVYDNTGTFIVDDNFFTKVGTNWSSYLFGTNTTTGALTAGAHTWDKDITFQSGALVTFTGAQNMGTHNLSVASNKIIANAALTGTGILSLSQAQTSSITVGGSASVFLQDATLDNITDGWSKIALGTNATSTGTITFVSSRNWNDDLEIRSNSGAIIFNAGVVQNVGANNLTITTLGDINISSTASLTGTGTFTINPLNNATIAIGSSAVGTITLSTTEIGRITNGWNSLVFGNSTTTGGINIGNAFTWSDSVTLMTLGVVKIDQTQSFSTPNKFTIATASNPIIGGSLSGSSAGTLTFTPLNDVTIGIGNGSTGTLNLDSTEIGQIVNNWGNVVIGDAAYAGSMDIQATTWLTGLTLTSLSGAININGTQTFGIKVVNIIGDNININAALNTPAGGSSSALTIKSQTAKSLGIGTGSTGDINIDDNEFANFASGHNWHSVTIGGTNTTAIDIYSSNLTNFQTTSVLFTTANNGSISVRKAIDGGTGFLGFATKNMNLTADVFGSNILVFSNLVHANTMGFGDGANGDFQLDNAELAHIVSGFSEVRIGTATTGSQRITFNAAQNWNANLNIQSGNDLVEFYATQNLGAHDLTINTRALTINGDLTGTGTLTIKPDISSDIAIGGATGASGAALEVDASEVAHFSDKGWSAIQIGDTADTNTGTTTFYSAVNWGSPVRVDSGAGKIIFNAAQSFHNITFVNINSSPVATLAIVTKGDVDINAAITFASGFLILSPTGEDVGLGDGMAGGMQLTNADIANINGAVSVGFNPTFTNQDINIGALTWSNNLNLFARGTGKINFFGDQIVNGSLLLASDTIDLAHTISGTGTLVIRPNTTTTTIGLGDGTSGAFNLTNAELDNILDGWSSITIGQNSQSGPMEIGAYTWRDPISFIDIGQITISGAQNFAPGNVLFSTNSNIIINADLTGAGVLRFTGVTSSAPAIGIGDGAIGTINFSNAELDHMKDGWDVIFFGSSSQASAMDISPYTWRDDTIFLTRTGQITFEAGVHDFGTNDLAIETNITPIILGTFVNNGGTLQIQPGANDVSMGIAGGAGTLQLSDAFLDAITGNWGDYVFGRTDSTQPLTVGDHTWDVPITLASGTGGVVIDGEQNMGSNNLTITLGGDLDVNADIISSGDLIITPVGNEDIGLGDNAAGVINIDTTEYEHLTDNVTGDVTIGSPTSTGAINIGDITLDDDLNLSSGGNINFTGITDLGNNDLVLTTNTTPVFTGVVHGRTLIIQTLDANTSIGVADAAGTLQLTNAFLNSIEGNWQSIAIGSDMNTTALTIGTRVAGTAFTFFNGDGNIIFSGNFSAPSIYARTYGAGDVVLAGAIAATNSGNSLTLVTNDMFTNNYGNGALSATNGRWLVYSNDPANDSRNNQAYNFKLYGQSYNLYPENSVTQSGSGFIYSLAAPTVTITANATTRAYGSTNYNYTITGLIDDDTLQNSFSGNLTFSSSVNQFSNAGTSSTYTIAQGSLASLWGYNISVNNTPANITITKADLTAIVINQRRGYNNANPTLNIADNVIWSGFANGETAAVLDNATLQIAPTATKDAPLNSSHAISLINFSDNNYNLVSLTNGTLTITEPLANIASRLLDSVDNNPPSAVVPDLNAQTTDEDIKQHEKNLAACGISALNGGACEVSSL